MKGNGQTHFGELLRRHRLASGLTQEALAERAGLSAYGLGALERGDRTRPQRETLRRLASALDLSERELLAFVDAARAPVPDSRGADVHRPHGGFLGAMPTIPLIARQEEFQRVVVEVNAVTEGEGRMVLLSGEPGIGKTRLAQEVMRELLARAFLVATGRCYENLRTLPYAPFLEALATAFASATGEIQSAAGRRWPYLSRILPDQLGAQTLSSTRDQADEQRLFRAVAGFLQAIGDTVPVALLLDDLHWADSSSLDLLLHLARHTRNSRIFLLGTYRDTETEPRHDLERAIQDLGREQLQQQVPVWRLAPSEAVALIAALFGAANVSEDLVHHVHRHTEGNPFFIREVVRSLVERGDIYLENGTWRQRATQPIVVPETVRSTIAERVSRLRVDTQRTLEEASIFGQVFGFSEVSQVGETSEQEIEAALEEALRVGVINDLGSDSYGFNHALTRQTLYDSLVSHRRRRLHVAAGEALERLPDPHQERESTRRATKLGWHFLEGGEPARALPYLIQAGDGAARIFAHAEAEQLYRTALHMASDTFNRALEAEVLEKLGAVLTKTNHFDQALEALERAATIHHNAHALETERRVVSSIGQIHSETGSARDGISRIQRLLRDADQPESLGVALLYMSLALLNGGSGRYSEQLEAAERAADIARGIRDVRIMGVAEYCRGEALQMLGRLNEAVRVLQGAVPLLESAGDVRSLATAMNNLGSIYRSRDLGRARSHLERALEIARQVDTPIDIAYYTLKLGDVDFLSGDWPQARRRFEQSKAISGTVGPSWSAPYFGVSLGHLLLVEGDREQGVHMVDEARMLGELNKDMRVVSEAQRVLAEHDLLEGRPDAAIARLNPLAGEDKRHSHLVLPVLARACVEVGELNRADHLVATGKARIIDEHSPGDLLRLVWVQGMMQSRRGQYVEAERSFAEAVSLARPMPQPFEDARILYDWGQMLMAKREFRQARQRLEDARSIFTQLGALPYLERTDRMLARIN